MSAATTVRTTDVAAPRTVTLGRVSLAAGVLAAGLTMLLSFAALGLAVVAVASGGYALARRGGRTAAAGTALGGSAIYLILLEVFVLGH